MARIYRISPNKRRKTLSLTTQLIIINLVFFIFISILLVTLGEEFVLNNIALTPALVLSGESLWTLITSMFMHGSFFHIFANMFSLFFIGSFLERIVGKKRFFWIYMISGLVGGIFFILAGLIFGDINTPAVGASGAIFGLLGALAVLVPFSRVYLIAGPLILVVLDAVSRLLFPAAVSDVFSTLITLLIFFMIFSLMSFNPTLRKFSIPVELPMWLLPVIAIVPLVLIDQFITPLPIGNSAHIGGLVVGLFYGWYLKKKFPNKTRMISRHFR